MFFTPPPPPPKPTPVVIWVHGTNPKTFLPSPFAKLIEKTSKVFFHGRQGLCKTSDLDLQHYPFILTKALSQCDPETFSAEHFYTFGWSGELTLEARAHAAQQLFTALKTLSIDYYEKDGVLPTIIVITHSHGGNVVLHMAEIQDSDEFNLCIHKAILLACPVQKHTKHLTTHHMFERIYSIHSHTDMIQIADPQGIRKAKKITRPLFSERHFDSHPKLIQACIYWKNGVFWHPEDTLVNDHMLKKLTSGLRLLDKIKKNRGLFHVEFNLLPFIRKLPSIISHLDELIDSGSNCQTSSHHDVIIQL